MPSYSTHDRLSILALPPLGALSCYVTTALSLSLSDRIGCTVALLLGHTIGSFFLNPDLDCHSRPYLRWRWLRWLWLPYRWLMSHRSPLSHGFLLGTTVRLLYLAAWIAWMSLWCWIGAYCWHAHYAPEAWREWSISFSFRFVLLWYWLTVRHPEWTLAFLAGLECGAMLHVGADTVVSAWKRFWRPLQVGRAGRLRLSRRGMGYRPKARE